MKIREAVAADLEDVLAVERAAFGEDEEAELTRALLDDPSAQPAVSLLAFENERAVGHVLFTAARLVTSGSQTTEVSEDSENPGRLETVSVALLAPLAVVPTMQKKGIGTSLIESGFDRLKSTGVNLVFVLGSPEYYPRCGFRPAGTLGFEAPYVLPEKWTDAWMVRALTPDLIGTISGKVVCADAISKPEYWQE